jgi:hypothetical protein
MSDSDLFRALDAAWPPPRRAFLSSKSPDAVTPTLDDVLRRIGASAEPGWVFVLLYLASESEGVLRARLLDECAEALDRLPARRWLRIDELARRCGAEWWELRPDVRQSTLAIDERLLLALRRWHGAVKLEDIRGALGPHVVPVLIATMHRNGHLRQDAVAALAGEVRGLPALLIRANDWAPWVRDDALSSLHSLIDAAHVAEWLRALPLLLRLEHCTRPSQSAFDVRVPGLDARMGDLIARVAALFREPAARAALLDALRTSVRRDARDLGELALRALGGTDRELLGTLLGSCDTRLRYRAVDAARGTLDDELLDRAVRDPMPTIRRRALEVLRERRPEEFLRRLVPACLDRSPAVRELAVFHLRAVDAYDEGALVAEARRRIAARSGELLGALGFLCDTSHASTAVESFALADHPSGAVRFLAKRSLIRSLHDDEKPDPRLLDDPSPKIARRLIALHRARGVEPDVARLAPHVQESPTDAEACAWLNTLASCCELWTSLPYVIRAMNDRRPAVAALARARLETITKRRFRSYVHPDPLSLSAIDEALRESGDPLATELAEWVRAVTGGKA